MKKISLILYSVAVMGMLSCGGNGNGSVKDADSVEIEVQAAIGESLNVEVKKPSRSLLTIEFHPEYWSTNTEATPRF